MFFFFKNSAIYEIMWKKSVPCGWCRTHDLRSGSQDHHPSKNSVQKTICCNLASSAPGDGRMRSKHVELRISINWPSCIKLAFHFISWRSCMVKQPSTFLPSLFQYQLISSSHSFSLPSHLTSINRTQIRLLLIYDSSSVYETAARFNRRRYKK